jgi:hypothetical protein
MFIYYIMGNSFAMNTVSMLDTTNKNEKIAKKYKTKCNNVYSSVNKDEDAIKPVGVTSPDITIANTNEMGELVIKKHH